jgi:hypothetical protein
MAESEKATEKREETERERKRREKREQTGDTPEAAAERRKQGTGQGEDDAKKRVGRGVLFS